MLDREVDLEEVRERMVKGWNKNVKLWKLYEDEVESDCELADEYERLVGVEDK